ncbi:uncharacterized protein TRAVEDRAFT_127255 [Trametes versicolor FP-101664 SS1]|uniref:uncharacterized protein n=1 Tax=Trametes versicolor (strain FP-101664) TaxID=717944 RepID=UPI0004623E08|nr:uncharacterized protein TRAVEDRAFT_127255 [Trametes versicolor FP-101664 SS1]EIW56965.1 hypothetical protein TRAVEDRAFT_127255 [Trametes versicolor FP-101664 SS1]
MEEQPPSLKRARLDDLDDSRADIALNNVTGPSSQPQQPFVRDETYWFQDGNIVLLVRSVGFKVYKGLLAEHSAVFRGMFVVAQGEQAAAEQLDGCPVVPLDDSPDDIRQLFRLIYPMNSNIQLDRSSIDIDVLSAVIRLDHKYELPTLQAQAMKHLTTYYTSRFEDWVDDAHASVWKPAPIDAIGAIALARLTNTPSILPTALYELCSVKMSDLLRGRPLNDGSFQKLSEEDLELYMRTRDKLQYYNVRVAFLFFSPSKKCIYGRDRPESECAAYLKRVLEHSALQDLPHKVSSVCALDGWLKNIAAYAATAKNVDRYGMHVELCPECKSYLNARDLDLRQQVWRKLPGAVGLEIEGLQTMS